VDWVVKKSHSEFLVSHPKISKLHVFDPAVQNWSRFVKEIGLHKYDEVWDLHNSTRTLVARLLSFGKATKWRILSKQRWRRTGFFLFKKLWPRAFRPTPLRELALRTCGLATAPGKTADGRHLIREESAPLSSQPTIAVMPASAWPGKAWPVDHFLHLIRSLSQRGEHVVVLGQPTDTSSVQLVDLCRQHEIPVVSAIGKLDLGQTATLFRSLKCLITNDTGLAHLAESVGLRVLVIFGPTHPDLGFGPALEVSRSVSSSLGCQPCSKDGRWCIRNEAYLCMKSLSPQTVISTVDELLHEKLH
jgi:heptosyltransferase-2